jgi:hypothetical protein
LVLNKKDAEKRKRVLFINADREYREGKNQSTLRPEDVEKISHVYHEGLEVNGYSEYISIERLEAEDFNLNIRRYVDNSPPPEPQDVRAHMHGGVPVAELKALSHWLDNYKGVERELFVPRESDYAYVDFSPSLKADKAEAKRIVEAHPSVQGKHADFHAALAKPGQAVDPATLELTLFNTAGEAVMTVSWRFPVGAPVRTTLTPLEPGMGRREMTRRIDDLRKALAAQVDQEAAERKRSFDTLSASASALAPALALALAGTCG